VDEKPKTPPAEGNGASRPRFRLGAWQPFTGSGIGAFADSPTWRSGSWILLSSGLVGLSLAWLLWSAWWPVVAAAAESFPDSQVELRNGSLDWSGALSGILAEAPKFAIALRSESPASTGRIADLQLELWRTECRLSGIAGFVAFPWPAGWTLSLDRRDAVAGWGAWKRPLLFASAFGGGIAAASVSILLGLALTLPVWLLGWILGRGIPLGGASRLALVSTVTPNFCAVATVVGYGLLWVPWPFFLAAISCHPFATLLLAVWAVLERPAGPPPAKKNTESRRPGKQSRGGNPFGQKEAGKPESAEGGGASRKKTSNPFRR
jgi:hypothetical protein